MANITLEQFIEATNSGHVFTVEFIKRTNGEHRVMNCRRGVKKGVKGVGLAYDPAKKNLLGVYDMQKLTYDEDGEPSKGAFRMINLEDLISLKMDKKTYTYDKAASVFIENA